MNPSNGSGYTVTETPPASDSHLGQTSNTEDAVTTPATTPVVSNIVLTTNGASSTDNFFETIAVTINGTDYLVSNTTAAGSLNTGTTGVPIAGTSLTLSGTDAFGNAVSISTTTSGSGQFSFDGLNPTNGSGYTVTRNPASQRLSPRTNLQHRGRRHDSSDHPGRLQHRPDNQWRQQHRQLL